MKSEMVKESIIFQLIDWFGADSINNSDEEDSGDSFKCMTAYDINLFGRTKDGKSVSLQVINFKPFFYLKVPDYFTENSLKRFKDYIVKKKRILVSTLVNCELVKYFPFNGFSNNTKSKFIKLTFDTKQSMNMCRKIFQNLIITPRYPDKEGNDEKDFRYMAKETYIRGLTSKPIVYELFESNVDPMIRMGHLRDISPSGWVKIIKYNNNNTNPTNCDLSIKCSWEDINPYSHEMIGPIRVCAFDIECTSSHGDFPQAVKTYETPAREIIMDIQRLFTSTLERDSLGHLCVISKNSREKHIELLTTFIHHLFSITSNKQKVSIDCSRIHTVNTKKRMKPNNSTIEEVIELLMKIYDCQKEIVTKKSSKPKKEIKNGSILSFIKSNESDERVSDIFINCKQQYSHKGVKYSNGVRNILIQKVTKVFDQNFPAIEGDSVVQISNCFMNYGTSTPFRKVLLTLGKCDDIDDCEVVRCNSEEELLLRWTKMIQKEDPDIITGYNSYGFDLPYMYNRAEQLNILKRFQKLSKLSDIKSVMKKKRLASAALGDNIWFDVPIIGRIHIDVMRVVQRDFNLSSWKLDYVASFFMNGKISNIEHNTENDVKMEDTDNNTHIITTDNTNGLEVDSYINIQINNGLTTDMYGEHTKFHVLSVTSTTITIKGDFSDGDVNFKKYKCTWCHAKDDMEYSEIFDTFNSTDETSINQAKRAAIGKYCMKDSILCIDLIKKLEIVANNIGMSNVCSVPLSWIFSRGQGAKTLSLVAKQCSKDGYLIPVMYMDKENDAEFEGAIVLDPIPGVYLESAIATLDYASLYPSCIISENMSHDSIVINNKWKGVEGGKLLTDLGYDFVDIKWDVYKTIGTKKKKMRTETSRFVQYANNEKGIIPRILTDLLKARKKTRKRIKYKTVEMTNGEKYNGLVTSKDDGSTEIITETGVVNINTVEIENISVTHTPFQQGILDGLQKAYKVTANSIYGQMGAKTSPVKMIPIAACTTATGRALLMTAKDFIHENYCDRTVSLPKRKVYVKESKTIYGDTDSVFVKFNIFDKKGGKRLKDKDLLDATISMGIDAGKAISKTLKKPHDLEYEKAFYPFILLSKKRYVGMKYEYSVDKCKQTCMGIVLKRRDNAKILKFVFGGAIEIIMKERDVFKAFNFVQKTVKQIVEGKYGLDYLIITKSLRTGYKNPESIAHKVLADRIGDRDPGNRPKSNDRIPYVFIVKKTRKGEKLLQGDRIETPSFIEKNKLEIDYQFYITNQIAKPVSQVFALIINKLPNYRIQKKAQLLCKQIKQAKSNEEITKFKKRLRSAHEAYASELLFSKAIRKIRNTRSGQKEITHFMNICTNDMRKTE
tara:strand:- start:3027 stop:7061 length:4035 start_codon:yes stop_codon:yes gene_type:complete